MTPIAWFVLGCAAVLAILICGLGYILETLLKEIRRNVADLHSTLESASGSQLDLLTAIDKRLLDLRSRLDTALLPGDSTTPLTVGSVSASAATPLFQPEVKSAVDYILVVRAMNTALEQAVSHAARGGKQSWTPQDIMDNAAAFLELYGVEKRLAHLEAQAEYAKRQAAKAEVTVPTPTPGVTE